MCQNYNSKPCPHQITAMESKCPKCFMVVAHMHLTVSCKGKTKTNTYT